MSTIASLQLIPCDQTIKILQGRELDRHQYSLSKPAPQVLSAYSTLIGNARENASKNRYRDIIAYDRTRVLHSIKKQMDASKEQEEPDSGHSSNYVNASLILEPDLGISGLPPRRYFIAAQGPVQSTIHAFLSLLLSSPSSNTHSTLSQTLAAPRLIVQVTPLVENRKSKCARYFGAVGERWILPSASDSLGIWIERMTDSQLAGWRLSKLRIGYEGDEIGREVYHSEYQNWGDHGVPQSAPHLIDFITKMNNINRELSASDSTSTVATSSSSKTEPPPILVHCSAGVGRTGTYIALSSLLPLHYLPLPLQCQTPQILSDQEHRLEPVPCNEDFIALTVDGLREQRTTMVQTEQQLRWIYSAFECGANVRRP